MCAPTLRPPAESVYREQCRRSFANFADHYCQVLSETAGPSADWIPFRLWPAQADVARQLEHLDPKSASEARKEAAKQMADARKALENAKTIEPGEATAAYLDQVVSRTALPGAIYLALVCLLPEVLIHYAYAPVYFGGTALLIVVCTVIDLSAQFRTERRFM